MVFAIALIALSRSAMIPNAGSGSLPDATMDATVSRDCDESPPEPELKDELGSVWPVGYMSRVRMRRSRTPG